MSKSDTTSPNRSGIGKRPSNKAIFTIILGVLLLLLVQTIWHPIHEVPLAGATPMQSFSDSLYYDWWKGELQSTTETRVNRNFGFRPALVRMVNQLRYSLFNEHTPYVVMGDDGYLFEASYRATVCGNDYVGRDSIQSLIRELDRFRNALLAQDKKLVVMLAPNKWRTMQVKIDWNCKPKTTNYEKLIAELRARGYAVYDGIEMFLYDHKQRPEYPLHSKQGTHWSLFGAALSADYLRYAFFEEGIQLPEVKFDQVEETTSPRNTDKDLHDLLNVMVEPYEERLAYPSLSFEENYKPKVTVIGDSYYWSYYTLGLHQGLFALSSKFFYYNRSMVAQDPSSRVPLSDAIRLREIEDSEAVLLVMGEPSLKDMGFGIQRLASLLDM